MDFCQSWLLNVDVLCLVSTTLERSLVPLFLMKLSLSAESIRSQKRDEKKFKTRCLDSSVPKSSLLEFENFRGI